MALNLFDNIFDQFTGKAQSQVPTSVPQAPRTSSYVAPNVPYTPEVQKPNMTLFSDEQKMFEKMKADNLDDNTAFSMLKKRRMDILGGNDISQQETDILKKMQADNVPVKQAVSMIQQRRKDQFNKKYEEGNLLQKGAYNALAFGAGNLETLAKYSGNALDFITGGTMGFGDEVKKMEQVTQSPEFSESSAFKAGTYAPDVALAVSPIGGGYLAGAKGLPQLAMRSGVVGAGFGATQPILEQGSDVSIGDIATGAAIGGTVGAVASPVLSKAFKYGQAGYYGGVTGAGKSIVRDLKGVGQAITPSGANISTKANRFNANEIREFTKKTGQSPGEFATSRGMTKVGDDAVVEATTLWQKSKDQADEALQAIKGRFKFTGGKDLLKSTLDDLDDRLTKTESPDLARIQQLKAKYEDSGLTMSEINEVKRAYSNNYKYSFVDAGSESALRSRNLQDAVRKWQFKVAEENGLTNLKDINKTTQGWKMFADSLSKKIQGSSGNNNVSLTDWIALSGGSPENIALYLGKKLASSDRVKSGAIKLFSKKTKPSIIQASKADIQQANFKKDVNRGVSGIGDRSGGESLVKPVGLLPAPTGKATGAKNFRVNQPKEAPTQKSDITRKSIIKRPTTTARGIKADVQLAKETIRAKEVAQIEKDLNTALLSKYNPDKQKATTDFIERAMAGGKIKKQEAIQMVENLYEKADGFQKPRYEKLLNDLYSNKKVETFDDLLNEKQAQTIVKTPRQQYLETPKGIYEEINKKANDRRYNPEKANILIAKFKEKTGIDLMKNPLQKFDEKGNVVKPIIKPKNAKQQVIKPKSTTTNVFGETIDKPSNKKGGFIKIPEIGKKVEPLVEEVKKYNSPNDAFGGKDVLYHGTTMDNLESIFKKGLLNIKDDKSSIKKIYLSSNIKDSERYTKIYPSKKPLLLAVKDSIEFGPEGSRGVRTDFMSTRTISPKEIAFRDDTTGKWVLLSDIYKTPVKNPLVEEAKIIYHGTNYDGVNIVPNNNPYKNQWGDVIYMTGDKKTANSYGTNVYKSSTEGKKFFDVNKKLTKNDIEEIGNNIPESQRKDFIREFTSSLSSTPREGKYIYQYFQYKTKLGRNYINDILKKMGYDGVYGYGNDEALGKIYGIFDTKNITK